MSELHAAAFNRAKSQAYMEDLLSGWEGRLKWVGAVTERNVEQETLTGDEVAELIESCNVTKFDAPYVSGFSWNADGELMWPTKTGKNGSANGDASNGGTPSWWSSKNQYEPRKDIADLLGEYK